MKKYTFEESMEMLFSVIIASVIRFFYAALAIYAVCKCFDWQYKWLYPLTAVLIGSFLRGMFYNVSIKVDKK